MTPQPTPWEGPKNGKWDYGDVGFKKPSTGRLSDYRITLLGKPSFGPLKADKVEVSGTFAVERYREAGSWDTGNVLSDNSFGFVPGNLSYPRHDEVYGMRPEVERGAKQLAVGESTECRVTFEAPTDEMTDFHWWVNGNAVAAWPGQKP